MFQVKGLKKERWHFAKLLKDGVGFQSESIIGDAKSH